MDKKTQHMHNAAKLLRQQHSGVLSTISLSLKGFPFGSVTPFLMTEAGDIVIYASDIAQHSRNMQTNDQVSLCVHDGRQQDSQASARVTIVGNAKADTVSKDLQAQYMRIFQHAKAYVQAHDFRFYLISTYKVRYIGGFGEIYWFSSDEWQSVMYALESSAKFAIDHMHEDHADALAEIVTHQSGKQTQIGSVEMLTCVSHGFHYCINDSAKGQTNAQNNHIGFVPFVKVIGDEYDLRLAMVDLTKAARALIKADKQAVMKPTNMVENVL
jgi:putative heme iron utilization protein